MKHIGLIPRNRMTYLPEDIRVRHEYCFFLHDECARILCEYEEADAGTIHIEFDTQEQSDTFEKLAEETDAIEALHTLGYTEEAKRVLLNTITSAMVSDCVHHIYEALRCFEKRKFIVGFNLLRKPLKDNLLYLAWVLGDEDNFYEDFMAGNPQSLTQSKLGDKRIETFEKAIKQTSLGAFIEAEMLNEILYDKSNENGLEKWFQHAVHLVTVQNVHLKTTPQNFNFIFKDPLSDDVYHSLYQVLPYVFIFLSHIVLELFNRVKEVEDEPRRAFFVRTVWGYEAVCGLDIEPSKKKLEHILANHVFCGDCDMPIKVTDYNFANILLNERIRCTPCRCVGEFPFSWLF